MRVVHDAAELDRLLEEAQGEARSAFGDGSVFLEKYLARARHLEVQILGDEHGESAASVRARLLGAAPASESSGSRAGGKFTCDGAQRIMRSGSEIGAQSGL